MENNRRERKVVLAWDNVWRHESERNYPKGLLGWLRSAMIKYGDFSRLIVAVLTRTFPESEGTKVLDAGCGKGTIMERLSRKGYSCSGIDLSPHAVKMASRGVERVMLGNITKLPFPDSVFDLTYNVGVLDQLSENDLTLALKEMIRVTKPGGTVVTINASIKSRLHERVKRYLLARDKWLYGDKSAFRSLKEVVNMIGPQCSVREEERGWLLQWKFISYLLQDRPFMQKVHNVLCLVLNGMLWSLNRLPGMVLITIIRVEK